MRPDLKAPQARRVAGTDPYQWLQERDNADVIAYLEAENHYTEQWLAPAQSLREQLFQEIRGRIRETDLGLPSVRDNWLYYQRTEAGAEYPRYYRCRRPADQILKLPSPSLVARIV